MITVLLTLLLHTGPDYLYPKPDLTPGAHLKVTAKEICVRGYSKNVRNVSTAEKRAVMRQYGVDPKQCRHGGCELDHFLSLELGGSNDIQNLWPEPANTKVGKQRIGFHEKDFVENFLHSQVCSGKITLEEAQHAITTDWYAIYLRIQKGR